MKKISLDINKEFIEAIKIIKVNHKKNFKLKLLI